MKQWQFWSIVVGLVAGLLTLGGYGYNISSFASGLASRVGFLEAQRKEDKQDIKDNLVEIKEDLKYIRQRMDEMSKTRPQQEKN